MRVIETSLDDDLAPLSAYLWSVGIAHRVFEERGRQMLEVADPGEAGRAGEIVAAWRSGRLRVAVAPGGARRGATAGSPLIGAIRRYPLLSALIVLSVVIFPFSLGLGEGRLNAVAALLLIAEPTPAGRGMLPDWQLWRWLTPILLHFSIVHLAFNCVVVIELGRRIEAGCGSLGFGAIVLVTGVTSNLAQLLTGGSLLFGGLSGVGYGLLGFLLVMARRRPGDSRWRLPAGLAGGLLIFLVVFSTGITEPFGLRVANAAHWGGLVAGGMLGLCWTGNGSRRRAAPGG